MNYLREGSTSNAILPISAPNVVKQHNEIGGNTYKPSIQVLVNRWRKFIVNGSNNVGENSVL